MKHNLIKISIPMNIYNAIKNNPEKIKEYMEDSNDYKRQKAFLDNKYKNDIALKLLERITHIEVDKWIKEYYQVEISARQIKTCLTTAKNQKDLGVFFLKIQPQIKNKKFPCYQPDPNFEYTLTNENIENFNLRKENALYPETIIEDFSTFFKTKLN